MEKIKNQIPTGTKEWASSNVNIISGCKHNCRYCYARKMAIRFGRKSEETWKFMEINEQKLNRNYNKRSGRVMFPSSHDIVPEYQEECFNVLQKLLDAGNSVLITSKPHFDVIKDLCNRFVYNRELIQFRFTITSIHNEVLKFWEENAPTFEERLEALKYASLMEYKTSVSIEPFLDKNPIPLIEEISPYVSETIWIGKMNYINKKCVESNGKKYYQAIRENYSKQNIKTLIRALTSYKKIRYKDSIKKLTLNIPSFQIPKIKIR